MWVEQGTAVLLSGSQIPCFEMVLWFHESTQLGRYPVSSTSSLKSSLLRTDAYRGGLVLYGYPHSFDTLLVSLLSSWLMPQQLLVIFIG
jgi:hypothetical protein